MSSLLTLRISNLVVKYILAFRKCSPLRVISKVVSVPSQFLSFLSSIHCARVFVHLNIRLFFTFISLDSV